MRFAYADPPYLGFMPARHPPGGAVKMRLPETLARRPLGAAKMRSTNYRVTNIPKEPRSHKAYFGMPRQILAAVSSRGRPSEGEHQPGQQEATR